MSTVVDSVEPTRAGVGVPPTTLQLEDLDQTPLAGAGNYLWKIDVNGLPAVAKVYQGSRSPLLYLKKTLGNVLITGRSSHQPRARCRVEIDCVRTWERHGFRCFGLLPQVTIDGLDRDLYMVFEYVPGRHFRDWFKDASIPLEERLALWRRWVPDWYRRHRIAVETGDRRLIHENGDVKHVMLHEDEFVYFDFEMVFTRGDVRFLVGREIVAYMRSVGRFFGEELYDAMADILVEVYPDKDLLMAAWDYAWEDPNPVMRGLRLIDRNVKPTHRKRWGKYNVARDLRERLDRLALNLPEVD